MTRAKMLTIVLLLTLPALGAWGQTTPTSNQPTTMAWEGGNLGLFSKYVLKNGSESSGKPALQGNATASKGKWSGDVWISYNNQDGGQEIDLTIARALGRGWSVGSMTILQRRPVQLENLFLSWTGGSFTATFEHYIGLSELDGGHLLHIDQSFCRFFSLGLTAQSDGTFGGHSGLTVRPQLTVPIGKNLSLIGRGFIPEFGAQRDGKRKFVVALVRHFNKR